MFERYYQRLISLATRKMTGMSEAVRSGEDIALSAMKSFCFGLKDKRISVESETDLWNCLFKITTRKVCAQRRYDYTQKRGKSRIIVSGNQMTDAEIESEIFDSVVGREPSPELASALAESADELLSLFQSDKNPTRQENISLKLQGLTTKEIGEKLGLIERTIFWNLQQIQEKWEFYKSMEFLTENLFQGASLDYLARTLEWPKEKIERVIQFCLELFEHETEENLATHLLTMKFFDPERYKTLLNDKDDRLLELEKNLGKIADYWIRQIRLKWASAMRKIILEEFKEKSS